MHLHVGTSGFAYKGWRGEFYPPQLPEREMLSHYARMLTAVEINSTFYRFPTPALLAEWAAQVPGAFRFALKVPRRITHVKRLQGVDEDLLYLIDTVTTLGPRLGPLLFQFPPTFAKDLDRCAALFEFLPAHLPVAFEFRHPGWFADDLYALLARHNAALCYNDTTMPAPVVTGDWGYIRRRRGAYSEAELATMAEELGDSPWKELYVFFKHEDGPEVALLARRWLQLAETKLGL